MLEYDPDKIPEEPSEELMRKAESLGFRMVQVVCLDPDQEQGVPVTFDAMISIMASAGSGESSSTRAIAVLVSLP